MRVMTPNLPVALLLGTATALSAAEPALNMIGRQSQNEGLSVVPAMKPVRIDGDLAEWDWSGRMWSFADSGIRDRYSAETAAMWDKDHLYVAVKWRDPTPLFNTVDPLFKPNEGWKGDSLQLRIQTDQPTHLTAWCFSPQNRPAIHLTHSPDGSGGSVAEAGLGLVMAFKRDADGAGYVQELAIPGSVLYAKPPAAAAGNTLRIGCEFLWGDPTGNTWPAHRYADNLQRGETSREFFWTNVKAWGDVTLVAKGGIAPRRYVSAEGRLQGTLPLRLTVPLTAKRVTLAIDAADGRRVRNLAGDFDVNDYAVAEQDGKRTVEVAWDCLDDRGVLVPPGTYTVRGLSHAGLGARYETTFYNPGTPAWGVVDGSGAWGADHCPPSVVAAGGDTVAVGWHFAEGGHGLIGIGPDGRKRWGDKHGVDAVAVDKDFVYAIGNSWYSHGMLIRFAASDGAYRPFTADGKERPFELPLADIFSDGSGALGADPAKQVQAEGGSSATPGACTAMAVHGGNLVLALPDGRLAVLDSTNARLRRMIPAADAKALAVAADGTLWAILGASVNRVDLGSGAITPVALPGLGRPVALVIESDGTLAVADAGADMQVKRFAADGRAIGAIGQRGGRPRHGAWQPAGMRDLAALAVDAAGRLWTVESGNDPRRVTAWNRDGSLHRDYIGNTGYSGTSAYLDERDAGFAYVGSVEMAIDRTAQTSTVSRILWVPDEAKNEWFPLWTHTGHWFSNPTFSYSSASGKEHRYLFFNDAYNAVYMQRGDHWQPVAALFHASDLPSALRGRVLSGIADADGVYWNDSNGDGALARGECTIVPGGITLGRSMTDWGKRLGPALEIWANGLACHRPLHFTAEGAPVYGPTGSTPLPLAESGDLVPAGDGLLLCLSFKDYPQATTGYLGVDAKTGAIRWSYPNPFPSVHGSHRATMPRPGLMIGALKICGIAAVGGDAGQVSLIRGNLGQDYFFTRDGLYIGALFQDGRLPGDALPAHEAELVGRPMEGFSEGGEPFNGWFGRQSDGVVRLTTGMAGQAGMILDILGLETVRRTAPGTVTIDAAMLARATADNAARVAKATAAADYRLVSLKAVPTIDGKADEWKDVPRMRIAREGSPEGGNAAVAVAGDRLCALFEVTDASPWKNGGKDPTQLFKSGDAVDLQFATDPSTQAGSEPGAGDVRLCIAQSGGRPVVVLMRPIDPGAPESARVVYRSPVGPKRFDRVEILTGAAVAVTTTPDSYIVELAVPLSALGLKPGGTIRGDAGIIASDAAGMINTARTYWSNQETNLVNDLPQEAWFAPRAWGTWTFAGTP